MDTANTPERACIFLAQKEKLRPNRGETWPLSQGGSVTPPQFCLNLRSTGQEPAAPWAHGQQCLAFRRPRLLPPWQNGSHLTPRGSHFPQEPPCLPSPFRLLSGSKGERSFAFRQSYSYALFLPENNSVQMTFEARG